MFSFETEECRELGDDRGGSRHGLIKRCSGSSRVFKRFTDFVRFAGRLSRYSIFQVCSGSRTFQWERNLADQGTAPSQYQGRLIRIGKAAIHSNATACRVVRCGATLITRGAPRHLKNVGGSVKRLKKELPQNSESSTLVDIDCAFAKIIPYNNS